jgi:MFS family permease
MTAPSTPEPLDYAPPLSLADRYPILRAFRHRNYRLFFAGQLTSLVGTFLTQAATLWFVYRLTHSTALMGTIGFLGQLPVFLLAPFAGVLADRVHRRNFLVLTQAASSLQSFGLAALAFWFGDNRHIAIPGLVGLAVFQGLANAFDMPARQAFLIEMVPDRADLANAIAMNSTMVHGARVIGPALAGLIIGYFGESLCFLLDGISYFAVIASLVAMIVVRAAPRPRASVRSEMVEGFHYVRTFAPVRTLLLLMAVMSLFGLPVIALLMPVFGDFFGHATGHGAQTFGLLGAASGVGSLAGAIYLASRRTVLGLGRVIAIATAMSGGALIAFSQSRHLWLSLAIVPFAGWGMMTCFASANTIIQTVVEDRVRGRVMAFFSMAVLGMAPFGALLGGRAAAALGHPADPMVGASRTLLIAGIVLLAAAAVYLTQLPAMRRAARPVYVEKGILPAIAQGLQTADDEMPGGGER